MTIGNLNRVHCGCLEVPSIQGNEVTSSGSKNAGILFWFPHLFPYFNRCRRFPVTIMAVMQIFNGCRRPSATIENLVATHIMQISMVAENLLQPLKYGNRCGNRNRIPAFFYTPHPSFQLSCATCKNVSRKIKFGSRSCDARIFFQKFFHKQKKTKEI